jgi:hypothetical protein
VNEFIAQVVKQGHRYRVALIPVSFRGGSPIVAASWLERDNAIFEADSQGEADAYMGQLSLGPYWSSPPAPEVVPAELVVTDKPRAKGKSKR